MKYGYYICAESTSAPATWFYNQTSDTFQINCEAGTRYLRLSNAQNMKRRAQARNANESHFKSIYVVRIEVYK